MRNNVGLSAVSWLALMIPTSAFAQSATEPSAVPTQQAETQDIIVTATKRSENLSQVPMSITAVSGETLQQKGITNVQDLTKITPGLTYVDSGTGVPVFSLRGVGFYDTSVGARPTVSVYLDEAPLPFSIMSAGAAFDLERVEVLKGPQGTLFGQNATGGAINYVAAKPTSTPKAGVDLSYGRFKDYTVGGFLSGPLTSNLNARIAFRTEQSGDWQKSYTRVGDTLGQKNFLQGRAILEWKPTSDLTLTLDANGFVDKSDTLAARYTQLFVSVPSALPIVPLITTYPTAPGSSRFADWDPNVDYAKDNRFIQTTLRANWDVTDDISLVSLTSYSHMNVHQVADQDGTALQNAISDTNAKISSVSQEVRLSGHEAALRWMIGANYARDNVTENDIFQTNYSSSGQSLPTGPFGGGVLYGVQKFDTKAAFGNLDLDLGRKLTLHGGVRYTQADLAYQGCAKDIDGTEAASFGTLVNIIRGSIGLSPVAFAPQGCLSVNANLEPGLVVGQLNQHNVSWRAGLDWNPADRLLFYFNVSRGYKGGSASPIPALRQEQYQPITQESVLAYELGFKASIIRGTLDANGALFYYDYTNKQLKGRIITDPNVFGPLETLVNVPKSRIQGAEFQINAYPIPGLSVSVGGTYINSKVTSDFENYTLVQSITNFKGQRFPYTPMYQAILDMDYRWAVGRSLTAFVGGNLSYRSKTTAGFGTESILQVKGYPLLDLQAGIEGPGKRWRVTLYGHNVTNQYYWTNVTKQNDFAVQLPGMPVTYGIQLSSRF
ncbi:TonB-dependent receptor [Sphingobium indicum]|nr:TonB-dependent receptor [Sphingobium indicum]